MSAFADTGFFIALLNESDHAHKEALRAAESVKRCTTSMWVLIELADGLANGPRRGEFGVLHDSLIRNPRFTIVWTDPATLDEAIALYRSSPDKEWSLTDCTSFVLMRRLRMTDALTTDHHFVQAGFKSLLPVGRKQRR